MKRVAFKISVINDTLLEGNESFTLTIMTMSLPNRVICGYPCMADVTIVDTSGESLIVWCVIICTTLCGWIKGKQEYKSDVQGYN